MAQQNAYILQNWLKYTKEHQTQDAEDVKQK
jgi:hypothetical protein